MTATRVQLDEGPIQPVTGSPVIGGTNDGTLLTDSPYDGSPGDDSYVDLTATPDTNNPGEGYVRITAPPAGSEIAGAAALDDPIASADVAGGWPYMRVKAIGGANYFGVQTLRVRVSSEADDGDRSTLWWGVDFDVTYDWREGTQADITFNLSTDWVAKYGPAFADGFDYDAFARDVNGGFVSVTFWNATSAFPDQFGQNSATLRLTYLTLFAYQLDAAPPPPTPAFVGALLAGDLEATGVRFADSGD